MIKENERFRSIEFTFKINKTKEDELFYPDRYSSLTVQEQIERELKECQRRRCRRARWAVISKQWMLLWRESKQTEIDNSELLEDGKLKLGLKEGYDFEILPLGIWEYFEKTFGGGPQIIRESVALNAVLFGIDLYPIALILHFDGETQPASVARRQTLKGFRHIAAAMANAPPASLEFSPTQDPFEEFPDYELSFEQLCFLDGMHLFIQKKGQHHVRFSEYYEPCSISVPSRPVTNYGRVGGYSAAPSHHKGKPVELGMVGLQNLGNTCYMNSVLSCFSHCLPTSLHLLNFPKNLTNDKKQLTFLYSFRKFLSSYWSNDFTMVNPLQFRNDVLRVTTIFPAFEQHDAHEFLVFLMDTLHESLRKCAGEVRAKELERAKETDGIKPDNSLALIPLPSGEGDVSALSDAGQPMEVEQALESPRTEHMDVIAPTEPRVPVEEMAVTSLPDLPSSLSEPTDPAQLKTNIQSVFGGSYISKITCRTCNTEQEREEDFYHLTLPVISMKTLLIHVTFFPTNGAPIKFGLRPYATGVISDLKALLSEMTDVPVANLKLSKVYSHKKFELTDNNSLQTIRSDDVLVGDEVIPGAVEIQVIHRKFAGTKRFVLFGFPISIYVTEGMTNNGVLKRISSYLAPVERPASPDHWALAHQSDVEVAQDESKESLGKSDAPDNPTAAASEGVADATLEGKDAMQKIEEIGSESNCEISLGEVESKDTKVHVSEFNANLSERKESVDILRNDLETIDDIDITVENIETEIRVAEVPVSGAKVESEMKEVPSKRVVPSVQPKGQPIRCAVAEKSDALYVPLVLNVEEGITEMGAVIPSNDNPFLIDFFIQQLQPLPKDLLNEASAAIEQVSEVDISPDVLRPADAKVDSEKPPLGPSEKKEKETERLEALANPKNYAIVLDWGSITHAKEKDLFVELEEHESVKPTQEEINFECSVFECINSYLAEEHISGDNAWFCPKCKIYSAITKKISFQRLPHILILQLKRFEYTMVSRKKIYTLVNYPLDGLDLTPYIDPVISLHSNYKLLGVSNHMGGLTCGHYTAYVKDHADQWFHINDSTVTPMNADQIATKNSYMLFYHSNACDCDHHSEITDFVEAKKLRKEAKQDACREAGLENGAANNENNHSNSNSNYRGDAMDEAMSSALVVSERLKKSSSSFRRYGPVHYQAGDASLLDQFRSNPYESSPYKHSLTDDAPSLSSVSRNLSNTFELAVGCEDSRYIDSDRETALALSMADDQVRRRDADMTLRRRLASEERRSHPKGVRANNTSQRRLPLSQARKERVQDRLDKRPRSPREMAENSWARVDERSEYQIEKSMRHEKNRMMNPSLFGAEESASDWRNFAGPVDLTSADHPTPLSPLYAPNYPDSLPGQSAKSLCCPICSKCVLNEDDLVSHVFEVHNESEAVFALESMGLG